MPLSMMDNMDNTGWGMRELDISCPNQSHVILYYDKVGDRRQIIMD